MTTTSPTHATSLDSATTDAISSTTSSATTGALPAQVRIGVPVGLVILLGTMQALGPLALDTYLPALPALAADLRASTAATQLTLTATLAGLALGQLVFGPLSDAFGRRRPLMVGLAGFVLSSVACAVAPTIELLVALRFAEGFTAAAAMVSAMAIARDSASGNALARLFSALMLVTGAAPVLSPVLGGQLLLLTDWRGIFALLAGLGVLVLLSAGLRLPETLPVQARHRGGLGQTLRTFARLLRDASFMRPLLALMLGCAALFGYLAGSPFLLQEVHGLSPQAYSGVFAVNTIGLVALSQLSGRIVHRTGPALLLVVGTGIIAAGGIGLLAATLGGAGLVGVLPALFGLVAGMGLVFPNAATLALSEHGSTAGAASALLGLGQFMMGAVAAPLVGLGSDPSRTMAAVLAVLTVAALLAAVAAARRPAAVPVD